MSKVSVEALVVTGQMFYFSTLACSEKKKKKKNSQGIRGGVAGNFKQASMGES